MHCTRSGSSTRHPPKCGRRFWTREVTAARSVPCIGFWRRHGEVRERRNQLRRPHYRKPELLAEAPNQVWSWDITKLRGPVKWTYYYLYVILDIFSRYVTGWMLAHRGNCGASQKASHVEST